MSIKSEYHRFKWSQRSKGIFRIRKLTEGNKSNPAFIHCTKIDSKPSSIDEYNTEVEWEDSSHKVKEYTFRILSYLDMPHEEISPDEIREQKRLFYFGTKGAKRYYTNPTEYVKYTTPEIFFMLLSDAPYEVIARLMKTDPSFISLLRGGKVNRWKFEYALIYKLRELVSKQVRAQYRSMIAKNNGSFEYVLYRCKQVSSDGQEKELGFFHGYEKAYIMRKKLIEGMGISHDELKENNTLNVLFPLERVTVIGDI